MMSENDFTKRSAQKGDVTAGMRIDGVSPIRPNIYKSAPRWRKAANDRSKT